MSYPVNRDLWESLESIFLAKAKELVKEIAEEVGKPEKLLWNDLVKDKIKLHIVEQETAGEQCMELVYTNKIAHRCRKPVYAGTEFCPNHSFGTNTHNTSPRPKERQQQAQQHQQHTHTHTHTLRPDVSRTPKRVRIFRNQVIESRDFNELNKYTK